MSTTAEATLTERIKENFGTIRRLCQIAGLDETTVRVSLYRNNPSAIDYRALIEEKLKTLDGSGYFITDEDRSRLRGALYTRYKSVSAFTSEHPEYSDSYMSYLLGGGIKYKKKKVKQVFKILGVE